jgi:predicted nucleic acid-binding protein
MILADTSVWIAHLRGTEPGLAAVLAAGGAYTHPFVIGELAMGNLRQRAAELQFFDELPKAIAATDLEVLRLVERHRLFGLGIGFVDAHLLASCRLTPDTRLWSRDRRLVDAAERLDLAVTTQP